MTSAAFPIVLWDSQNLIMPSIACIWKHFSSRPWLSLDPRFYFSRILWPNAEGKIPGTLIKRFLARCKKAILLVLSTVNYDYDNYVYVLTHLFTNFIGPVSAGFTQLYILWRLFEMVNKVATILVVIEPEASYRSNGSDLPTLNSVWEWDSHWWLLNYEISIQFC